VAFTQDTHFEGDLEWEIWPEHCRQGSWGWEIIDDLKPRSGELVCPKNRYDGFYGTWLEHYLNRVWQVEHLIIVGTVANICVAHTAASAGLRWFHMVIPADGISAQTEFDQALALRQVSTLYTGDVVKSVRDIQFER
jgi:nicotinamidase-related amidase